MMQAQRDESEVDLGWALGSLLRGYRRLAGEAIGELPGGMRGYQVLAMVGTGGCGNQAEIAERLDLDRTAVTHLVDGLEAEGLVVRQPDPRDRRARRVSLTAAGERRSAELGERIRAAEDRLLDALSPAVADELRATLATAARGLGVDRNEACSAPDPDESC